MKEILDKIEEATDKIKYAADHSMGVLCIFICSLFTCNYTAQIDSSLKETNHNLNQVLLELAKQDTVYIHEK